MARKTYSDSEREQIREALLIEVIRCIAERGLIHSSIDFLCGKVGISKNYFYSFFSSKEELVLEALRYQQPKLLHYARQLMDDPALDRWDAVGAFLKECCYGVKHGIAVLSIEEEQEIYRWLSEESFKAFREDQIRLFEELLEIFGLPKGSLDPRLMGNLTLGMIKLYKAIPDTLPFLFPEAADEMIEFQVRAIVAKMQWVKDTADKKEEE